MPEVQARRRVSPAAAAAPTPAVPVPRVQPTQRTEVGVTTISATLGKKEDQRAVKEHVTQSEPVTFLSSEEIARVSFGVGRTIATGNFESLRLDIRIELPCKISEVDTTYADLAAKVADLMHEEEAIWVGGQD